MVSAEYQVTPGDKSPRAEEAAQFIRDTLEAIRFDAVTDKMLYGLLYGYAVAECIWQVNGDRVELAAIYVRRQRRFGFAPDKTLRLKTTSDPEGEPVPERKFWVFCAGAETDDEPYGLGLGHWLYWPVWFKRNGLKFWAVFLEKFGMPTAVGKYGANATPEEKKKLLAAVQAIQTDSGIILPDGMMIELLEAVRSGKVEFSTLYDKMDAAIAKVVLSQTMTTEDGSSQSQATVHQDVGDKVTTSDAGNVCDSFNRTVVRWLVDWNFPGTPHPKVSRNVEDPEDTNVRAERDERLFNMGYRPTPELVEEVYGPGYEPIDPPAAADSSDPQNPPRPAAEFAQHDPDADRSRDAPAAFSDMAEDTAEQIMNGLAQPVRALLDQVGTLEEFRDRLLEAYAGMESGPFANLMQQALMAAEVSGRFETTTPPPEVPEGRL